MKPQKKQSRLKSAQRRYKSELFLLPINNQCSSFKLFQKKAITREKKAQERSNVILILPVIETLDRKKNNTNG
jgi:hypothetical protein